MDYTPLRIYVKLPPATSRALGRLTDRLGCDDPRQVAANLIRQGLQAAGELPHLCPQCDRPTIPHPDPSMTGIRYCLICQESVAVEPSSVNSAEPCSPRPELVEGEARQ
jgi:hypothetical protein